MTNGPIGEVINDRPTQTSHLRPSRLASMPSDTYQTGPERTIRATRRPSTVVIPSCGADVAPMTMRAMKEPTDTRKLHTKLSDNAREMGFLVIATSSPVSANAFLTCRCVAVAEHLSGEEKCYDFCRSIFKKVSPTSFS